MTTPPAEEPALSRRGGMAEVGRLALPAVLHTLSDTLMHVVDSIVVGRLGVAELAGVGLGGIWLWTVVVAFVGSATGVQTFVAQSLGAGRKPECGRWLWQGFWSVVPVALLWAGLLVPGFPWLLHALGTEAGMADVASQYVGPRLLGLPALIGAVTVTSFRRGIGDTATPLLAAILANVANILLTVGLVFGLAGLPQLGVAGAGLATALANWLNLSVLLAATWRRQERAIWATLPWRPVGRDLSRFLRTGLPIGGQWLLDMISFAVFTTIVARMGTIEMAANQAMIQLLSLSFMQAVGLGTATAALVGRYVGAGDPVAAHRTHASALKLGLLLAALVAVLFLAVPEQLLGLFTRDPQVLALGRPLLALGALFQLVDAIGIIASGSLRGAGDTRFPFVVQSLLAWFLRLPLIWLVAVRMEGGLLGAWVAELGYILVLGGVWLWRFHGGSWQRVRI